jgi:filamentous hemagglutinin family protein
MKTKHWLFYWRLAFVGLLTSLGVGSCICKAVANTPSNIQPDSTLGRESSQVIENFQGRPIEVIRGGATRGINLFHSFREFNVSEGRGAYFFSPNADIQNILARVTGSNRSEILGRLGTFGESRANLFLMNPNGIVFGEGASLDVGGSFAATTANAIAFGERGNFSATNPQAPGLLTVNPSAFLFNQVERGAIAANQSNLRVASGKKLTLVGGDIGLNGSILQAPGGKIELNAIAGIGAVGLNPDSSLNLPDNLTRANINIVNSGVDVAANNGGSIGINAGNLSISNSTIQAGIASGLGTVDSKAGDITINTTGSLQIAPQSFIVNWVFPNATGKGGDIRINTDSMTFNGFGSGYISASTWGKGDAGSVTVKAKNDVTLNGSTIFSIGETDAVGNAGNIDISANNLLLTGGGRLNSSTFGQGNGGKVIVNASDRVSIDGVNSRLVPSGILNTVEQEAVGEGGDIQITAGSLSITNSGKLDTSVFGRGIGGNIIIDARNTVSVDGRVRGAETGSAIFSTIEETGIGSAGNIDIKTGSLFLTNGGEVQSLTRGQGNAGNINVDTRDSILIDGFDIKDEIDRGSLGKLFIISPSAILSRAEENSRGNAGNIFISAGNQISLKPNVLIASDVSPSAKGNGGNIDITTDSLLLDNALIRTANFGQGNAGNITIKASDRIFLDKDAEISSSVARNVEGNGGNINVTTGSLVLDNDAEIAATTNGRGNGGNITIKAGDRISLDNDSAIGSLMFEEGIGKGGDIFISTGSLSIAGAAQLDTSTFGEGDAGNVIINARDEVLFTGAKGNLASGILSTAERQGKGNAGNININSSSVNIRDGAVLSTITTKQGNAGSITIQARDQLILENQGEIKTITSGEGDAGNISVKAGDRVNLDKYSVISSEVAREAKGNGGTISIEAESLSMTNVSQLRTSAFGRGNAGDVVVNVRGDVFISDSVPNDGFPLPSAILSIVGNTGIGDAGDIRINANNLFMKDDGWLLATTRGTGNSGNIFINASDRVTLENRAIISNIVGNVLNPGEFGNGQGGIIRIDTGTLSLLSGSQLQASTFGRGDAGDIIINAGDSVLASGFGEFENRIRPSAIFSVVAENSTGDGGDIRINTGSVFVEDGARFSVSTSGQGKAGNIAIDARDNVVVDGFSRVGFSELSTATQENATREGGTITVNTNSFRVSNRAFVNAETTSAFRGGDVTINANNFEAIQGGRIFTTATNEGQAGNITVNADTINLSGTNGRSISGLFANTTPTASARGGNIQVNARQLNMSDRAQISVNSQGSGIAGDIDINSDRVELRDNAKISAESSSVDGGNINLNSDLFLMRSGGQITTNAGTAQQGGNGGNIDIFSRFIIAILNENSDITANAYTGTGGNINIQSQGIFGIESRDRTSDKTNDITASSQLGLSGNVSVTSPDNSGIQNNLTELPTSAIDTNALIANSCIARTNQKQENSFTITGTGGLPNRPGEVSMSNYSTDTVRGITNNTSRPWKKGDQIVEPTGVYRLPDGSLVMSRECE